MMTPLTQLPINRVDRDWLPDSIQPVIDLIGLPATLQLIETFGGTPVSVPPLSSSWPNALRDLLDDDQAHALSREYGGLQLQLPPPSVVLRELRNASIADDILKRELGARDLARKYAMSYRWAKALRRRVLNGEALTQYRSSTSASHTADLFGGN